MERLPLFKTKRGSLFYLNDKIIIHFIANNTDNVKIYPNPVNSSRFYIQYKDATDAMTVTVTDLQGRVLFSQKFGATKQELYLVNFSTHPKPGIYLVIVNGRYAEMLAVVTSINGNDLV